MKSAVAWLIKSFHQMGVALAGEGGEGQLEAAPHQMAGVHARILFHPKLDQRGEFLRASSYHF